MLEQTSLSGSSVPKRRAHNNSSRTPFQNILTSGAILGRIKDSFRRASFIEALRSRAPFFPSFLPSFRPSFFVHPHRASMNASSNRSFSSRATRSFTAILPIAVSCTQHEQERIRGSGATVSPVMDSRCPCRRSPPDRPSCAVYH